MGCWYSVGLAVRKSGFDSLIESSQKIKKVVISRFPNIDDQF